MWKYWISIKLLNKCRIIEKVLSYWMNIELSYWMNVELLNKFKVIEWI